MKKIGLLRHGDIGSCGRYIGKTDKELSPLGRQQIVDKKVIVQELKPSQIYCSPKLRCKQSFELLGMDGPLCIDDRIREIDFGDWEEKRYPEIAQESPHLVESWVRAPREFSFPHGEAVKMFEDRIQRFWTDISRYENDTILIISHGGVIRHLLCLFLCLSYENHLCFQVEYGRLATVDYFEDIGVLTGLNI